MTPSICACVLAFAACAPAESHPGPSPVEWLESWREARQCLVADAEDTRTGVAISLLEGRDCTRQLHRLGARNLVDDPQTQQAEVLVSSLESQSETLSQRTKVIAKLDELARRNGQLIWTAPSVPLQTLDELHPVFGGKDIPFARFNGGVIEGEGFLIEAVGDERQLPRAQRGAVALPSRTWTVSASERPIAAADAGSRRVVVRKTGRSYAIDSSRDGGRHWMTRASKTSLVAHWQDAHTGAIELLVRDENDILLRRRIDPRADGIREQRADSNTSLDPVELTCRNGGIRWSLDGDRVARFAEAPMRLVGHARHGELDCRGEHALILRRSPEVVERCHQHCWEVFAAPGRPPGHAALFDDGRWMYAAAIEDIVAVWTEPSDRFRTTPRPTFYRLPKSAPVVALAVLADRPVLVTSDNGFELIPLK